MHTVRLGPTDETVSALCLGTMYFGSRTDEATSWELLDAYYEAGGRFLDTANKYATWLDGYDEPRSEPLLAEWIEERGVRDELFVATKMGFPYPGVERGLAPEQIRGEVEKSLDRLGLDTIDLLYAHGDDYDTPQEEYVRAFGELVDEGTVRHLGASNVFAWRLARADEIAAREGWTEFACVQPRYSYLIPNRGTDFGRQVPATDELIDYCRARDRTVIPYTPLLKGCYGREDRPVPDGYVNTENAIKMDVVQEIAAERGVDGNQVVLAWMLDNEPRTIPLFGCSTVDQLETNLGALELDLTDDERDRLDGVETLGAINR